MSTQKRILIVDDDRDLRTGLNQRLQASGYQTVFAQDGVGAIAAARREKPDLILLDIGLPAGDGFVVLERLKDLPDVSAIPVIVLSARDRETNESKALASGARAFFSKPADPIELMLTIGRFVGAKNAA